MIRNFIEGIRSRRNGFYSALYALLTFPRRISVPAIPVLHSALYWFVQMLKSAWLRLKNMLFNEPMFRSQTESCGRAFRLFDDLPNIIGAVRIRIGDNVGLEGDATIAGGKLAETSILEVGNDTYMGYQTQFFIGPRVSIGSHVLIANRVTFVGYDSHPLDPVARAANEPPDETGSGPITVEDHAWIGSNCIILKNVRIGRAAVVATGSVVTRDVPPFSVVAGNPARVVKQLDPVDFD